MSSLRQIEANRANGAKSRGPVTDAGKLASAANSALSTGPTTPEGKARAARNAIRHGILAFSTVLDEESIARFSGVLAELHEELQPITGIETRFVETMALAEWRRLRLVCLEKTQLADETRRQEQADFTSPDPTQQTEEAEPRTVDAFHYTALAFEALCKRSGVQEILNRHELRFDRQFQRALNGFRQHRAARLQSERRQDRKNRALRATPDEKTEK